MSALRLAALLAAAWLALLVLRETTPSHAVLRGPVVRDVAQGAAGQGIGYRATLTGVHLAPRIRGASWGGTVTRDTGGTWLIAQITLTPEGGISSAVLASWRGPSGRVYDATGRIGAGERLLPSPVRPGQPERRMLAVFELPAAEAAGGRLVLRSNAVPGFDAELRLAAPPPVQTALFDLEAGGPR